MSVQIQLPNEAEARVVSHVYSGKDGRCCCGCAGIHRYASFNVAENAERRGYPIDADEVNDAFILKVAKIVALALQAGTAEVCDNNASCVVGGRLYVAYLSEVEAPAAIC